MGGLASRKLGWRESRTRGGTTELRCQAFWKEEVCLREGLAPYERRKKKTFVDRNGPGGENIMQEAGQLSSAAEGPAGLEDVT